MSHAQTPPSDLAACAARYAEQIRAHFGGNDLAVQQVLCLAEEAGEVVGAYRRWSGMARRSGPWSDVEAELADVVITAYVTANILGIDLDAAWRAKAGIIAGRGWRDGAPGGGWG